MAKNPFEDTKTTTARSAYRAVEWAMMAKARGHFEAAEAWMKADSEGRDDRNFSEERRAELARKFPKAFKNGMMVLPEI